MAKRREVCAYAYSVAYAKPDLVGRPYARLEVIVKLVNNQHRDNFWILELPTTANICRFSIPFTT